MSDFDILDESTILDRVDAYSIYSFYIGREIDVGEAINSPLRPDDTRPSFALFLWEGTLLFKDHGWHKSGDVFHFVRLLFGYNHEDALSKINIDFELGLIGGNYDIKSSETKGTLVNEYKVKPPIQDILILSKKRNTKAFITFYSTLGITKDVLKLYNTTEIDNVQFVYKSGVRKLFYPKELAIAYRILTQYKLYFPHTKFGKKFMTNYPHNYVEGYMQLKYHLDFLIITKSMKEVMFFRSHYDWDTVAGKSETTMITRKAMMALSKKYKYIFIWLDNDVPGQLAQKKYLEMYPFLVPIFLNAPEKDPTDYYVANTDKEQILNTLKQLVTNGYNTARYNRELRLD